MSNMEETIKRYVVYSPSLGFFREDQEYCGEYNFTDKLSRAQKWVNIPGDLLAGMMDPSLSPNSPYRGAEVREVVIAMTCSGGNDMFGPIRKEFAELDIEAEKDIEAMSRKRWIRWKRLKKILEFADKDNHDD